MNTIKKIGLVSAVAFALFAFNACGDDSNSTSASAENGSLSSAVEEDESSSSVIPDPDRESSSSSRMSSSATTENLDKSSSSSVVIPGSSSSVILSGGSAGVEGSSSSSAKSSSSVNSSSSVKSSSSSSVKQSSSSVKSSSSKTQNPWGTDSEWQPFNLASFEYGIYTDTREPENIREYHYLTIYNKEHSDSLTVFAENLNIGKMIDGSENQSDNSKIERYCYDNDTLICHYYGGLYQWAEMMGFNDSCNTKSCTHLIEENHQGICPNGWRLLTADDIDFIFESEYAMHGFEDLKTSFGFGGYNTTGFSLVPTGSRVGDIFRNFPHSALWFYPVERIVDGVQAARDGRIDSFSYNTNVSRKTNGLSVRCVKVE